MVTTNISVNEWREKQAEAKEAGIFHIGRPFIVCPICGNKRCPHATDRAFECTGSNEPGQKGSVYE